MQRPNLDIPPLQQQETLLPELEFGQWPISELMEAINDPEIPDEDKVGWIIASILKHSFGTTDTVGGEVASHYEEQINQIFDTEKKSFYANAEAVVNGLGSEVEEFLRSEDEVFIISLDGASGSGKTQVVQVINDLMQAKNGEVDFHVVHADHWQGTERGSAKREQMNNSYEEFNRLFYDRGKFDTDLGKYIATEPGKNIELHELYDGNNGGKFNMDISKPTKPQKKKKRILLVDGYDATRLINAAEGQEGVRTFRLFYLKDPAQALVEANLDRDVHNGADAYDRFVMRFRESLHQYWQVLINMSQSDAFFCDVTWLKYFITERLGDYSAYAQAVEAARENYYQEFLPTQKEVMHTALLKKFMDRTIERVRKIITKNNQVVNLE